MQTKKAKKDYLVENLSATDILSNLIQVFTVYSLLNYKSFGCKNFFILRKKGDIFFSNFRSKVFIFQLLKIPTFKSF